MRTATTVLATLAAGLALAGCMGTEPDKPKPRLSAVDTPGTAFGATLVGTRKQLDFTLANSDAGFVSVDPLTSIAISVSGAGLTVSHNCPATLDEGNSCFITVYYEPGSAAATLTGQLRVTSNAEESPTVLALTGSAVTTLAPAAGAVHFDGNPSTDFAIAVGQPQTRSYTLHNIGNADDAITITGPTQTGWTFDASNCPATLVVDATCVVAVRFTPTATGASVPSPLVVTDAYNTDYGALTLRLGGTGL